MRIAHAAGFRPGKFVAFLAALLRMQRSAKSKPPKLHPPLPATPRLNVPPLADVKQGSKLPELMESSRTVTQHAPANRGKVKADEPAPPHPDVVAGGSIETVHFRGPDFFATCSFFDVAGTPIVIAKSPRGDRLAFSFAVGACHVVPLETVESVAVPIGQAAFNRMVALERAAARIADAAIAKAAAR